MKAAKTQPSTAQQAIPELDLSQQVVRVYSQLQHFMRAEFQGPRAMDSLTGQQFGILGDLQANGPLSMSRIAAIRGVTRAAATVMVDRLVARRLLRRVSDPQDRRKVMVSLTPEGDRLMGVVRERTWRRVSQMIDYLSPPERARLRETLSALVRVVEEASGANPARQHRPRRPQA